MQQFIPFFIIMKVTFCCLVPLPPHERDLDTIIRNKRMSCLPSKEKKKEKRKDVMCDVSCRFKCGQNWCLCKNRLYSNL